MQKSQGKIILGLFQGQTVGSVNLESGMHGGRRYEMKSEREAELDYTRKMLMPL